LHAVALEVRDDARHRLRASAVPCLGRDQIGHHHLARAGLEASPGCPRSSPGLNAVESEIGSPPDQFRASSAREPRVDRRPPGAAPRSPAPPGRSGPGRTPWPCRRGNCRPRRCLTSRRAEGEKAPSDHGRCLQATTDSEFYARPTWVSIPWRRCWIDQAAGNISFPRPRRFTTGGVSARWVDHRGARGRSTREPRAPLRQKRTRPEPRRWPSYFGLRAR
jgi:hypothetical protein